MIAKIVNCGIMLNTAPARPWVFGVKALGSVRFAIVKTVCKVEDLVVSCTGRIQMTSRQKRACEGSRFGQIDPTRPE